MRKLLAIQSFAERRPNWPRTSVTVRGFGSIASADLKLGGLTILVGKNNTGKSYAAMLLWAIHSLQAMAGRGTINDMLVAPNWFREEVERIESVGEGIITIEGEQIASALNAHFKKYRNSFVQRLMTFPEISIGSLSINTTGRLYLHYRRKMPTGFSTFKNMAEDFSSWQVSWKEKLPKRGSLSSAGVTKGEVDELFRIVVDCIITQKLDSFFGSAAYIPAARTGLMLTIGFVASSLIGALGLNTDSGTGRFSLPTIRFLQTLSNEDNHPHGRGVSIADFLENNILNGKVITPNKGKNSYEYQPNGCDHALPMHTVSSMVSEISPILTVLRSGGVSHGLVLEEPEAHLHLSAQRFMARAIARLVNSGIPVVITTHSDTFLQQINLLIRLKSHPDKAMLMEKYGYAEDELIDISEAEAYEFISEDGVTVVHEAEKSERGFAIESLNEALFDIATEAVEIN